MELREFAETILYGNDLTRDKLLHPKELSDLTPGSEIFAPLYPTRPPGLEFGNGHMNQKIEFPNQNNIENERQRGIVLHFFANHELLAMELMALTLLRFPLAPKNFRMGIAKTILEEQKHMQMYIHRMQDFGISFGEIPVNDFFWKCLSNMNSPMDYVTKLSMTFEQANLDFSLFYMHLMQKIGDHKTAEILKIVFEEEIGHVKHGVVWFDKWRDQSQSQWQCYVKHLTLPLTPARAKGIVFAHDARVRTGLSQEFIDELFVFSASKGRPPDIYYFNPCCELEVARGTHGYSPVKSVQLLQADCASVCLFLAAKDDIVLVPKKPSNEFLQKLKICGFELPEWHEYQNQKIDISQFTQNIFGTLKPWGWSPESAEFLKSFTPRSKPFPPIDKNFYSKVYAAQLSHLILEKFIDYQDILTLKTCLPIVCSDLSSVSKTIGEFLTHSPQVVLKSPYGTAGQNMKRVHSTSLNDNEINWIHKVLKEHSAIIIEPWFERKADFSTQLKIENKKIIYLGETRFLTDARGQYLGTVLGKKMDFLCPNVLKFLYSSYGKIPLNFTQFLKQVSFFIGEKLLNLGFEGPFGIDTFIYKDVNSLHGFRIKFISEINPRFTMGRVALEISKRILPGITSLWIHLRVKDIEEKFGNKQSFIDEMMNEYPLGVTSSFKPQIKQGFLFTNDITQANNTATVLIVGKENIENFLDRLGLDIFG